MKKSNQPKLAVEVYEHLSKLLRDKGIILFRTSCFADLLWQMAVSQAQPSTFFANPLSYLASFILPTPLVSPRGPITFQLNIHDVHAFDLNMSVDQHDAKIVSDYLNQLSNGRSSLRATTIDQMSLLTLSAETFASEEFLKAFQARLSTLSQVQLDQYRLESKLIRDTTANSVRSLQEFAGEFSMQIKEDINAIIATIQQYGLEQPIRQGAIIQLCEKLYAAMQTILIQDSLTFFALRKRLAQKVMYALENIMQIANKNFVDLTKNRDGLLPIYETTTFHF